jgi:hypothetical protein
MLCRLTLRSSINAEVGVPYRELNRALPFGGGGTEGPSEVSREDFGALVARVDALEAAD